MHMGMDLHMHIYIYIYMYMLVNARACRRRLACVRHDRERGLGSHHNLGIIVRCFGPIFALDVEVFGIKL